MPRSTRDDERGAVRVIVIVTIVRFLVAALLPLGIDESYEVVVARRLTLSYFDHPPAVFWLSHAAAALGGESPIAQRWPFVLMFALTSWMLFLLTARLFGSRAGVWAVITAQIIPVFSLSSGSWVLPDGPLLGATIAAALALSHAIPVEASETLNADVHASSWGAWLAVGLALGCAGLSKYHAALFGVGVAVFVLSDATARRWLLKPQPYVAVVIAALCVLPVFIWNAQHEWVSFRFQAGRAASHGNPITALLQNIAGQAGYLLPWFWVPLVALLARGLGRGASDRAVWFCCCLGAPPVLVFTLASLGGRAGLPHWPAPGFFMLLPLLGAAIARWEVRAPQTARRRMTIAGSVFATLLAIVVSHAATGWVASFVPTLHRKDPAFELLEYRSLRDTLTARGVLQPARFIATTDWLRGAKFGYALGASRPTLVLNDEAHQFPFASDIAPLIGTDGLLLLKLDRGVSVDSASVQADPYRALFDTVRFIGTTPVLRGVDTAVTVGIFHALHLRQAWPPSATASR